MVDKYPNILGKDVNVHRKSGSNVRGVCVNQFSEGILVKPNDSNNVWIPFTEITELFWEDFKPVTLGKFEEVEDV
jgi:hypothetical protein